jgi:hypothetical protein
VKKKYETLDVELKSLRSFLGGSGGKSAKSMSLVQQLIYEGISSYYHVNRKFFYFSAKNSLYLVLSRSSWSVFRCTFSIINGCSIS